MYCYNCMNDKGSAAVCPFCNLDNSMEPAPHQLRPGTVLGGKYIIGYVIGEGGFGITYVGRDTTLDMRVAVKEFYPAGYTNRNSHVSSNVTVSEGRQRDFFEKGKQRFLQEARNVAKFSSEPGIVDVRDYFEENGTAYIIMEYLDGVDLGRYLRTYGPMAAEHAFRLMLPIMNSLKKINAAGIIHRDISPDNIMYMNDGSLTLMDFGSARYYTSGDTEMSVMLKQGYSPEEQYRKNGSQGPWTDVYGMCATLYRMITGRVPLDSLDRTRSDTLLPPSALGIDISAPLEAVLMYGLAVFSENRCQNFTELIDLTERALNNNQVNVAHAAGDPFAQRRAADAVYKTTAADSLDVPVYTERPVNTGRPGYGDSYTSMPRTGYTAPQPQPQPPQPKKKSPVVPIVVIATVAVVAIAGILTFFLLSGKEDKKETTPTSAPSPTQEVTEAPTARQQEVLDVTGWETDKALKTLKALGFNVTLKDSDIPDDPNKIVDQRPKGGTMAPEGSEVILYYSKGRPTEKPTQKPTEKPTYSPEAYLFVVKSVDDIRLYRERSRVADYILIPAGSIIRLPGDASDDKTFSKAEYDGHVGYVQTKYLVLKKKADGAPICYDTENSMSITCTSDVTLYSDKALKKAAVTLHADDYAMMIGDIRSSFDTVTCVEIYYNKTIYYISQSDYQNCFDVSYY